MFMHPRYRSLDRRLKRLELRLSDRLPIKEPDFDELISRLPAKERENAERIVEAERKILRDAMVPLRAFDPQGNSDPEPIMQALYDRRMRIYLASYLTEGRRHHAAINGPLQCVLEYFVANKKDLFDFSPETTQAALAELALRGLETQSGLAREVISAIVIKECQDNKIRSFAEWCLLTNDIDMMDYSEELDPEETEEFEEVENIEKVEKGVDRRKGNEHENE